MKRIIQTLLIIVLVGIIIISLWPIERKANAVDVLTYFDKVNHLVAYGTLSIFVGILSTTKKKYIQGLIYCLFLGFGLEIMQSLIPGRNFSTLDMIANCLGLGIGSAPVYVLFYKERLSVLKRRKNFLFF